MADERIENIDAGEKTTLAADDLFVVLDSADSAEDPDGTVKNVKFSTVSSGLSIGASKTSSFTAEVGVLHPVAVTTAQIEVTFPSTPSKGNTFGYFIESQSTTTGDFAQAPGKAVEPNNPVINNLTYSKSTSGSGKWGLWLDSEMLIFRYYDATVGWQVVQDGRTETFYWGSFEAGVSLTSGTYYDVDLGTGVIDQFGLRDAGNDQLDIKRNGNYFIQFIAQHETTADGSYLEAAIYADTFPQAVNKTIAAGAFVVCPCIAQSALGGSDDIIFKVKQDNSSSTETIQCTGMLREVLSK